MLLRLIKTLLLTATALALALSFSAPTVLADPLPPQPPKPLSINGLIAHYAALYGVSVANLSKTLKCESGFNPAAVGDGGTSFGIAQIHLTAHPDITKLQALNPDYSIRYMAQQFSLGNKNMWTCAWGL